MLQFADSPAPVDARFSVSAAREYSFICSYALASVARLRGSDSSRPLLQQIGRRLVFPRSAYTIASPVIASSLLGSSSSAFL